MARITHYDQGSLWRPTATFAVGGTPTDPTTVTVRVKKPDGTVTVHGPVSGATGGGSITRVSAGVFRVDITLDDAGYWYARFEGTGAATATEEHEAIVDPSQFFEDAQLDDRALVSLAEAKEWLQQQNVDTSSDLELARVINDISDRFHQEAQREFKVYGTNPQPRIFAADALGWRYGLVNIGDASDIDTVEILDRDWTTVVETVDTADYELVPLTRQPWEPIRRIRLNYSNGVNWLRGGYRVRVTGSYGFPAVPGNVRQAVLEAVVAAIDRDVENYSTDISPQATPEGGGTILQVTSRPMFLSMPPGVLSVAWSYRDPQVL